MSKDEAENRLGSKLMDPEFKVAFDRLRAILAKHAGTLVVAEDSGTKYCLEGKAGRATLRIWGGKKKKEMIPVAWAEIERGYVSFHLMPVYADPALRDQMSDQLVKRMQGKSCFNFKVVDELIFEELDNLTTQALKAFREAEFIV